MCGRTARCTAVWVLGFLLMGGGIGEIIQSFTLGRWSGTLLHLLIGLLYAVVGIGGWSQPGVRAILVGMSHEVTRLLDAAAAGNRQASADLLPLVYAELRQLAAARVAAEPIGQTLQATALVHEAYLRLVGPADTNRWDSRGHFFAAAAEAMRRILVDNARRKQRLKHGGERARVELDDVPIVVPELREDLLALDAALDKLKQIDGTAAELIQLRYFAGLSMPDAAKMMDISLRSAERAWTYARAWLHAEIEASQSNS